MAGHVDKDSTDQDDLKFYLGGLDGSAARKLRSLIEPDTVLVELTVSELLEILHDAILFE